MKKIILASASERRQMLMNQIGAPFELLPSNIDEETSEEVSPFDLVSILSERKAMHALSQVKEEAIIIAADTIVALNGKVMGKPKTKEDAFRMLSKLSGCAHSVYTGVTLINMNPDGFELKKLVDNTRVYIRKLSDGEIWSYIETGEPFDKAGAYAIQEKGSLLIEKIEGDYYTVVGLPLVKIYLALRSMGVELTDYWGKM